jgi:hypothetical protein
LIKEMTEPTTSDTSLTDTEREELAQLRANAAKAEEEKKNPPSVEDTPLPDTHWLHLADGQVILSKGVMSAYEGIPVIGAYAIPAELADEPSVPEHKF